MRPAFPCPLAPLNNPRGTPATRQPQRRCHRRAAHDPEEWRACSALTAFAAVRAPRVLVPRQVRLPSLCERGRLQRPPRVDDTVPLLVPGHPQCVWQFARPTRPPPAPCGTVCACACFAECSLSSSMLPLPTRVGVVRRLRVCRRNAPALCVSPSDCPPRNTPAIPLHSSGTGTLASSEWKAARAHVRASCLRVPRDACLCRFMF